MHTQFSLLIELSLGILSLLLKFILNILISKFNSDNKNVVIVIIINNNK